MIGLRRANPELRLRSEFDEKIIAACKKLMPGATTDESLKKAALAALTILQSDRSAGELPGA